MAFASSIPLLAFGIPLLLLHVRVGNVAGDCSQCNSSAVTLHDDSTLTTVTSAEGCCDSDGCATLTVSCVSSNSRLQAYLYFAYSGAGAGAETGSSDVQVTLTCNNDGQWEESGYGAVNEAHCRINA